MSVTELNGQERAAPGEASAPDRARSTSVNVDSIVTLVIDHKVRAGQRDAYEAWLKRTVAAAREQEGHLGVNVIRPEGEASVFTIVIRFAAADQLDAWINSDRRHKLVDEVLPLLEEGDKTAVHADPEFWFTPSHPAVRQPPRWKQAVLTYFIICPLTMIIPQLWQPLFREYPVLGGVIPSNLLITFCIVVSVVYVLMPWVSRLLAGWLNAR